MRGAEVGRADRLERLSRTHAHLVGHDAVAKNPVRHEERRQHGRLARDAALAVARDEALMEVGGHDAELRAQLGDVPPVLAEHAHRRRPGVGDERALVMRQQADEDGLPGAVRTEDGRVFALANRQPEPVEDAALALDDRRIEQLENGLMGHSFSFSFSFQLTVRRPAELG